MARRLTKRTATEKFRCRKCELLKKSDDFYRATNTFLDTNQRMSVCKDCVKEIFDSQMTRYENMEKAFLSTCKTIDVMYDENVIAKTHEKMDEMTKSGKSADSIFGIYMRLLFASNVEKDLTFKEPISPILVSEQEINGRDIKKLEDEWGKDWVLMIIFILKMNLPGGNLLIVVTQWLNKHYFII